MYYINDWLEIIERFMDAGGNVLWLIAATTFIMWTLVFERIWYYKFMLPGEVDDIMHRWEGRTERKSWNAHAIREKMISEVTIRIRANLDFLGVLVDAKSMAGGVSKATIPTMAGMVAALSGVFANTYVSSIADRESELLADHLTTDH